MRTRVTSYALISQLAVIGAMLVAPAAHASSAARLMIHARSQRPPASRLLRPSPTFVPTPASLPAAPVGNAPQSAAEDYSTHTLYVPNSGDNTVSVVNVADCSSGNASGCAQTSPTITVGTLPLGVAVDEATDTVYVANAVDDTVSVIDGASCNASDSSGCGQTPATVSVGAFDNALAVDPVTNTVFVTNQDASPGTVSVIDGNSCNGTHPSGCGSQPIATVPVGGGPSGVDVNPVTNTVYVANTGQDSNNNNVPDGNTLSVIDGATCQGLDTAGCAPVGTVRAGVSPAFVAVDPANNTVYVGDTYDATDQFPPSGAGASAHEGTVSVVDGSTCDARDPFGCGSQTPPLVTVGRDPIGLSVDASNHSIYVANALDDTLSVIDATSCNGTRRAGCDDRPPTIAVGGAPSDALVDAAQHTVYVVASAANSILVLSDLRCDAETSSTCRRPVDAVPAGNTPSAAATDERFQTVYVGDTNRFQPPYTVSMINAAACNVHEQSGCTHSPPAVRAAGRPFDIAVNQRTNTVYVASSGPLQVIDAASCNARKSAGCDRTAAVPAGGYAAAVDASTDTIYSVNVHNDGSGYVSIIDGRRCQAGDTSGCAAQTSTATATVAVGRFPAGVAVDAANHTVYVTNLADGTVSVIDTTHCHAGDTSGCAGQTPQTVNLPNANGPIGIAVDPTTHTAYATEGFPFTPGAVALIDTSHCHTGDPSQCSTQTPTTIPVPPGPVTVQIDLTTDDVYLGDLYDSSASVIDGRRCNASDISGCSRIRKFEVGSNPSAITFDRHNHTVYVPNFYDNDASVFGTLGSFGS